LIAHKLSGATFKVMSHNSVNFHSPTGWRHHLYF